MVMFIQYSPWTSSKATSVWTNGSADPTHSFGLNDSSGKHYFWDHNLTINDGYLLENNCRYSIKVRCDRFNICFVKNGPVPQEYLL